MAPPFSAKFIIAPFLFKFITNSIELDTVFNEIGIRLQSNSSKLRCQSIYHGSIFLQIHRSYIFNQVGLRFQPNSSWLLMNLVFIQIHHRSVLHQIGLRFQWNLVAFSTKFIMAPFSFKLITDAFSIKFDYIFNEIGLRLQSNSSKLRCQSILHGSSIIKIHVCVFNQVGLCFQSSSSSLRFHSNSSQICFASIWAPFSMKFGSVFNQILHGSIFILIH